MLPCGEWRTSCFGASAKRVDARRHYPRVLIAESDRSKGCFKNLMGNMLERVLQKIVELLICFKTSIPEREN